MYIWQFGINGRVFIGRTWKEYQNFIRDLCDALPVSSELSLIVYVHNLSYEFQFMRLWFDWEKVFALKSRTPVYAIDTNGIEYRCSYILSGYSLANLGKQLLIYPVNKKTGDLDYSLIRNSKTPLTEKEYGYCINDALVVMAYIQEQIETEGSISRIPLTKTGYVRRFCRRNTVQSLKERKLDAFRYREKLKKLTIEPDEYETLKRAFSGGFTHASAFYAGNVVEDVTSYDFTSSYPYVILSEQFPASKGRRVTVSSAEELRKYLTHYCCIFDIELINVEPIFIFDHYISVSKCWYKTGYKSDNGRLISAECIRMTITEQDYAIIRKTYDWESMQISNMWVYEKEYLPADLIRAVLTLYADKTTLKGVKGSETDYLLKKGMLNAVYGMMVTDIVRPEYAYEGKDWKDEKLPDLTEELNRYNAGFGRFLFYPWGIYVTAYARRNLWTGILEFGPDYVYSDTDSIKTVNTENHMQYIREYNRNVRKKLQNACRFHDIDMSLTEPKTIDGEKKPIGIWDYDGHYTRFKTLGAKRYMIEENGNVNITVSGLNKRVTVPYLCRDWRKDNDGTEHGSPFDKFRAGLYVPAEYTGKSIHTYIDTGTRGKVTDYMGNTAAYKEKSSIHMEPAEYSLSISEEYSAYLLSLGDDEEC